MSSMSANESMIRSACGSRSSSSRGRVVVRATIRPAPARLAASNPARASSKITQSAGETPHAPAARRSRKGREVDLRVGFAARHHVARDRRIEIRPDRTAVEHEIYVGLASRRTHGARNPRRTEPFEQLLQPFHRADVRGVYFAVDGFLLVGQRREALFADHLLGHHQPHDVVVAHAETVGEFLLPVGHAVTGAEYLKGTDMHRGVVHQGAVHVEQGCFFHRRFHFDSAKVVKIPDTSAGVGQNLSRRLRLTAKFCVSCPGVGSRWVSLQMQSTRKSLKMFSTPNPAST